jgi:fructose-1,6-bisphosphatase I
MALTLQQYLANEAEPRLAEVIGAVADGCRRISAAVRLGDVMGALETENVQGEVQKKLDVLSNDILLEACAAAPALVAIASEEMDDVHPVRPLGGAGRFLLLFDPLDGSSNIEVNVSIGTIFSILPAPFTEEARDAVKADFMQPGRNQTAAGYVIYGPQTTLVLTVGAGVHAFNLHPVTNDWVMVGERLSIPPDTKEFSINASNMRHWAPAVRTYIAHCLAGNDGPRGKNFNMRWVASMVADVHRMMVRGGVFLYPWDAREPDRPGKLRLMYEANPMAMLVEHAGGAAYDGTQRILDIEPTALHQRVAVILGSRNEVEHLELTIQRHAEAGEAVDIGQILEAAQP